LRHLFPVFTGPPFAFAPDPARVTPRGFPLGVSPGMANSGLSPGPLPLGFPWLMRFDQALRLGAAGRAAARAGEQQCNRRDEEQRSPSRCPA
jgi:hypothetical protein